MAKWIKAYEEKDFSGQVKLFVHEGRCIALFKLGDGIYAIDDECSYAQACYLKEQSMTTRSSVPNMAPGLIFGAEKI
jgi:nitrite reductase/ring-hydroxylating ferredoxin subunit